MAHLTRALYFSHVWKTIGVDQFLVLDLIENFVKVGNLELFVGKVYPHAFLSSFHLSDFALH